MFQQPRKPKELLIYQALKGRMNFSRDDRRRIFQLESGYQGELAFSKLIPSTFLKRFKILYDVNLSYMGKEAQYDVLIFLGQKLYHLDIKNYAGDYYIDNEHWFRLNGREIENPLYQLQRADILLKHIVADYQLDLAVSSRLVFINESFHLYQADKDGPYLFRAQLLEFFNQLLKNHALGSGLDFQKFYNVIHYLSKAESKYAERPEFDKDHLDQGVKCRKCKGHLKRLSRQTFKCLFCRQKLSSRELVLNQIETYRLLFPNEKITASKIYEWCDGALGMSTIYRGLKRNKGG